MFYCLVQGFLLSFVGQLVGTDWTVEIGDFSQHKWMPVGTLCGSEYHGVLLRATENLQRTQVFQL